MAGAESSSLVRSYTRALLPRWPGSPASWPALEAVREGVRTDADHLRRYRALCGFAEETAVPPTYPHLAAFPMSMDLMTRRGFPFRILGVVHIRNEITQLRPIHRAEPLDYRVWIEEPHEHPKGTAFDVGAQVRDTTGELVWSSVATYLRRRERSSGRAADPADLLAQSAQSGQSAQSALAGGDTQESVTTAWRLPADLGRRYAAVSGDLNPIHLYPWSARIFGFKRQIAHGMWSAARCLAAIDAPRGADPEASYSRGLGFTVEFRAPVILPSTVALTTAPDGPDAADFTLASTHSGRAHIVGRIS